MAKFDVVSLAGKKVGEIELSDAVFAAKVKPHLFYEVVKAQLASRRSGSASTKERSFVKGGGKKPWRQKGTGRARQGSIRSYQWVGGGTWGGPHPRDYSYRPPRKVRAGALRSVISLRASEQKLVVLENLDLAAPKTKAMAGLLKTLGARRALFVDKVGNEKLALSTRNLARSQYLPTVGLNVYDVLRHEHLIVTQEGAREIERRLAK
ncbi:MAG TPA: 50S ribosomal protein L4 [Myxococcota bacterium]|jgi:large subunit ribosomal protein L4|nr:50S ribosomal protein L4 [Myxococcota bacterium]